MNHEPDTLDTDHVDGAHGDLFDERIADALRTRSDIPPTDLHFAHREVLEQAGRVRRRRTSLLTVGTTAVLVVGAWAAIATRGGEATVKLAEPEVTTTITATDVTATTLRSAATVTTIDNPLVTTGNTIDDSDEGSDDDGPAVTTGNTITTTGNTITTTGNTITTTGNTTANTTGNTTGNTIDDSDDGPGVTTGNTTVTTTGNTTVTTTGDTTVTTTGSSTTVDVGPAPFTQTYDSSGGSITVAWDGTSLSLQATNPQSGYTAEVEDVRSDRVKVRFRSEGGGDSRIEVRIEGSQATVDID